MKNTFYKNNRKSTKDIPLEVIEHALKDNDCDVRQVAMNACQNRDVPLEVIERWLKDDNWYTLVRTETYLWTLLRED